MKDKFQSVIIYNDSHDSYNPFNINRNIEFVLTDNLVKRFVDAWTPIKKGEWVSTSRAGDGRSVYQPQNYEQFLAYLSQTKVDEKLGDIRVFYTGTIYLGEGKSFDAEMLSLEQEGYGALLDVAKEELYEDGKVRDEETKNHIKRTFVNQANKLHKEMTEKYKKENHSDAKSIEA